MKYLSIFLVELFLNGNYLFDDLIRLAIILLCDGGYWS